MSYTAREVEEALEGFEYDEKSFDYGYVEGKWTRLGDDKFTTYRTEFDWSEIPEDIETPVGKLKRIEQEGGYEGSGEHVHVVIQLVETGQYFKKTGYYESFGNGTTWDGALEEKRPVERTVVFYE